MAQRLNLVADEDMPHVHEWFSPVADITLLPGRQINAEHLIGKDALLCRSVTQVNAELLQKSSIQFVGSATIGVDHLQTDWLDQQQIGWANAAGCNAAAVAQYILSGISVWLLRQNRQLDDISVGIVGAGNVGTCLANFLDILKVPYYFYDPPLVEQGDPRQFVDFKKILSCDVITLHVPLTQTNKHKTFHLFNEFVLQQLTPEQLLINASRGAVIDGEALTKYLSLAHHAQVILDVFEHEPNVSDKLVNQCLLATPHIAGHTLEGKSRGSWMIYQAFCRHFNLDILADQSLSQVLPEKNALLLDTIDDIRHGLLNLYDVRTDHQKLLNYSGSLAEHFDELRKNYARYHRLLPRRDYDGWQTIANKVNSLEQADLAKTPSDLNHAQLLLSLLIDQ
ncbi:4-phosphoerythronate dehydrogenase [Aliikangiella maris]|uniref:4-phosphoerythronate dehydrogenase n=2 Tax=Aliikangiella maris TaxID=3162458 RepID=A0ABV3MJG3_9GAMM